LARKVGNDTAHGGAALFRKLSGYLDEIVVEVESSAQAVSSWHQSSDA
jgi:hypothetical protein